MSPNVIIRPYEPRDRKAVRRIASDTVDLGEPVEHFFPDREVFADFLASYYTDDEPQSLWIAECEKEVVGYLTGCLDSRRYFRRMLWRVGPKAVLRAIGRGLLLSRQMWKLLGIGMRTLFFGGCRRHIPLEIYPAHLHVNVQEGFRGQEVGRHLMERFFGQLKETGILGVYASVREDNPSGCHFFEKMGFTVVSRYPRIWFVGEKGLPYTVIYGKKF